jgi:hypothetical protein
MSPITKTTADRIIAKTIKPMVCGSFNKRKLMIEKTEARDNSSVASSRKFILYIIFLKLQKLLF